MLPSLYQSPPLKFFFTFMLNTSAGIPSSTFLKHYHSMTNQSRYKLTFFMLYSNMIDCSVIVKPPIQGFPGKQAFCASNQEKP